MKSMQRRGDKPLSGLKRHPLHFGSSSRLLVQTSPVRPKDLQISMAQVIITGAGGGSSETPSCPLHNRPPDGFCRTCLSLVCFNCVISQTHNTHQVDSLDICLKTTPQWAKRLKSELDIRRDRAHLSHESMLLERFECERQIRRAETTIASKLESLEQLLATLRGHLASAIEWT